MSHLVILEMRIEKTATPTLASIASTAASFWKSPTRAGA
jgi:hypothetical protein